MGFKVTLPDLANKYIKSHFRLYSPSTLRKRRSTIEYFHNWLEQKQLTFLDLSQTRLIQFEKLWIKKGWHRSTRIQHRQILQKYFIWLYKKEILKTHPKTIFPRITIQRKIDVVLPKRAKAFLLLVETQSKPSTVINYQMALRCFYEFMKALFKHKVAKFEDLAATS